ncbi:schlafen-like protein 1 [Notolabrus celidotus]|uniref:schlafen-like protein 1 n=1 Tax=Notolabrus celidotus TaxID=1203425 RepID=UPI001490328F|nr:schlafen-like protein 1 [Notolabrus celidotus]
MNHPSMRRRATKKRKKRQRMKPRTCFGLSNTREVMSGRRRNRVRRKTRNRNSSRSWSSGSNPVQPQTESILTTSVELVLHQDITKSKWLDYGAYVGNETRTIEFKAGLGGYMKNFFKADVLRYGCAFLNSDGGSLVVGVNDDGFVRGVPFSHKSEDETRQQLDIVMLAFTPALFPFNYSLSFLPVVKPGQSEHNLRVLCLTFKAPSGSSEPVLYTSGTGRVLIRRDASVQCPLDLPVIIEWYRQKFPYLMTHFVCQVLSRENHFVDHRSMMDKIIALQNIRMESTASVSQTPASTPYTRAARGTVGRLKSENREM